MQTKKQSPLLLKRNKNRCKHYICSDNSRVIQKTMIFLLEFRHFRARIFSKFSMIKKDSLKRLKQIFLRSLKLHLYFLQDRIRSYTSYRCYDFILAYFLLFLQIFTESKSGLLVTNKEDIGDRLPAINKFKILLRALLEVAK